MISFKTQSLIAMLTVTSMLTACQNLDSAAEQASVSVSPDAETARFNVWLDERYEEQLQFSPMSLTILGRKDHYDAIDDISEQAARDQAAWSMSTVEKMNAEFDRNSLTTAGRESFDLWTFQAQKAAKDLEFLRHGYLFGELGGWEDWFPTFLINFHKVDDEIDRWWYSRAAFCL
jgi:hypothetical protein